MVWWFASTRHDLAISPWVRTWLRSSFTDRFFHTFTIGLPWWTLWGLISLASRSADPLFIFGWAPWAFWVLDAVIDHYHTNGDLNRLTSRDDVVLATRAEYVGGHPQLPHGRFAYLMIRGSQQNPMLSIHFPSVQGDGENFDVPLLDLEKTEPKSEREQSLTETLLASLDERAGGLFKSERVTLNVDYHGLGGRKHKVELTSFFRGNDEIRNWRNYLVCAQAEADTDIKPFGPWKSLKPAPEEVISHAPSGDGDKVPAKSGAFERR